MESLAERSRPFLDYLEELERSWEVLPFQNLVEEAGGPDRVAVVSVDLIRGFCDEGPLASPRVGAAVPEAARILRLAHELGVRSFAFPQDTHPPDSPEFAAWPPHCIGGTPEAEMVETLRSLPFAEEFAVLPKHSVNSFIGTRLEELLLEWRPSRLVAFGVVTDICAYQLAMHLRLYANVYRTGWEVVVSARAARTYDLPREVARQVGAMPHDGDLLHLVFLYHMQLNGVRVVRDLV